MTADEKLKLVAMVAATVANPSDSYISDQRGIDRSRNPHGDSHKPWPRDAMEINVDYRIAMAKMIIEKAGKII